MSLQAVVTLVDNLTAPLRGMGQSLGGFNAQINATNLSLVGLGVAIGALAGLKQIFDGMAEATRAADALDDLSEKTGIAASKLEEYSFAAKMSGSSIEGITSGLNRLGRSIGMSAEETSKQAEAFAALGISTSDANGNLKSSEQIFGEIADKFKDFEDTPEKTALGIAVFGQRFNELNPLLSKGSEGIADLRREAEQLRGMGPEAFDAFSSSAGTLFDGIDKLKQIFMGFFSSLASEFVPVINVVIQSFIESYKSGGLFAQMLEGIKVVLVDGLVPAMKATIQVMRSLGDVVDIAGKGLGALGAIIASVASGEFEQARSIYKAYKEDVGKVAQSHVEFTDKLYAASNANDVATKKLEATEIKLKTVAPAMKAAAAATKPLTSALKEMVEQLKIANQTFGLDEFAKKRLEVERKYAEDIGKGIKKDTANRLRDEALAQIERNRTLQEGAKAAEAAAKAAEDEAAARAKAVQDEATAYERATKSIADYNKESEILAYEATLVGKSSEERARLLEKFREEMAMRESLIGLTAEHAEKIKEDTAAAQARRDVALEAAKTARIENEIIGQSSAAIEEDIRKKVDIAKGLFEQGKITTDDYVAYIKSQLKRVGDSNEETVNEMTLFWQEAAKGMQSTMSSFFFDIMQGKFESLGSRFKALIDRMIADALAANLANALFGNSFTKTGDLGGWIGKGLEFLGSFGGGKATGGPVEAGKFYKVGEMGPELFAPAVNGSIIPNNAISSMRTSSGVQINITAMDSQDVRRALERDNRWISDLVNKTSRTYNLGV